MAKKRKLKTLEVDGKYEFIPKFDVHFEDGKVPNKELPPEEQIVAIMKRLPLIDRKAFYRTSFKGKGDDSSSEMDFDYDTAVKKCVVEIRGLEDAGITNGHTLIKNQLKIVGLDDLITELYFEAIKSTGVSEEGDITAGE